MSLTSESHCSNCSFSDTSFVYGTHVSVCSAGSNKRVLKKLENKIIQQCTLSIKLCFISFYFSFLLDACHFLYKCNDHGTCKIDGSCQCDPGFFGNDCSGKLKNRLSKVTISSKTNNIAVMVDIKPSNKI